MRRRLVLPLALLLALPLAPAAADGHGMGSQCTLVFPESSCAFRCDPGETISAAGTGAVVEVTGSCGGAHAECFAALSCSTRSTVRTTGGGVGACAVGGLTLRATCGASP